MLKNVQNSEQAVQFQVNQHILRGTLHLPQFSEAKAGFPGIVLCHGFIGNKLGLHRIFVKAARAFSAAGYAVLRFDFSGCGESDGEHRDITIDQQIDEASAALAYLKHHPLINQKELSLIGLSMGGAVAALTAARQPVLKRLVLWAPVARMFSDIEGIVGQQRFEQIRANGVAEFEGFELGRPFLESLQHNFPLEAIQEVRAPLLIIHGTGDQEISPNNTILYHKARQKLAYPTASYYIAEADHTFSSTSWEKELFSYTLQWLAAEQTKQSKTNNAITLAG